MADPEEKERKRQEVARLAAEAADCTACDLHLRRHKVVFGVGNAASPLMLVGEGPGMNEDLRGEPFVGRAGKLLDECLFAAGMKREHVYITNVVKCRASLEQDGRIQNRPPTPIETGTCVPLWLEKQIHAIQPLVILCLGGPAASAIIHKGFQITRERGRFFETKYTPYAIATLHPAYVLRLEGEAYDNGRQTLIDDLTVAKERTRAAMKEPRLTLF